MFDRIKKLFSKRKAPVMVIDDPNVFAGLRVDLVTYKPIEKELLPIKNKVIVPDFEHMEFEPELGEYNLSLLSDEAKHKIIEIIKEDEQNRAKKALDIIESVTTNDSIMSRSIK